MEPHRSGKLPSPTSIAYSMHAGTAQTLMTAQHIAAAVILTRQLPVMMLTAHQDGMLLHHDRSAVQATSMSPSLPVYCQQRSDKGGFCLSQHAPSFCCWLLFSFLLGVLGTLRHCNAGSCRRVKGWADMDRSADVGTSLVLCRGSFQQALQSGCCFLQSGPVMSQGVLTQPREASRACGQEKQAPTIVEGSCLNLQQACLKIV